MARHLLALIILSILAIVFLPQAHYLLQIVPNAFNKCEYYLAMIIPGDYIGWHTRRVLALILVSLIIGAVAQLIYLAFTRRNQYQIGVAVTWAVWLLLVAMIH